MALATIVAFASCNKNDENKDSLVGISWKTVIEGGVTASIDFNTETDCTLSEYYQDALDFCRVDKIGHLDI